MCTMHVFLGLVQVLDIWQLEGRSGAQAAARSIYHIWWQRWDPSMIVVQGDHGSRMSVVMELIEVDLRRKAGSISKSET